MESLGPLLRVNDCGFAKLGFCAATVVLLRHYIDGVASPIIRHCERVNGMSTALQSNLPNHLR